MIFSFQSRLSLNRGQLPKQFLILGVLTLVILISKTHQISARIPEMSVATDLKSFADQFPDRVVGGHRKLVDSDQYLALTGHWHITLYHSSVVIVGSVDPHFREHWYLLPLYEPEIAQERFKTI